MILPSGFTLQIETGHLLKRLIAEHGHELAALILDKDHENYEWLARQACIRYAQTFAGVRRVTTVVIVDDATGEAIAGGRLKDCSPEGEIFDVLVHPDYRGRQFGRAIMTELIRLATERGMPYLRLISEPGRVAARTLYRSMGFRLIWYESDYKPNRRFVLRLDGERIEDHLSGVLYAAA